MAASLSSAWTTLPSADDPALPARLTVRVERDFAPLRAEWRALERNGHATPYQAYDFCERYFRHVEAPSGGAAALVTLRDPAGDIAMLLPLVVRHSGPVKVARFIGGKQANFNMPLYAPSARPSIAELRAALLEAGRAASIDLFSLHAQPVEWQGFANPMAGLATMASPSPGYKLALAADSAALLKRRLSKDTRRKTRQKEQKLQAMGRLAYVKPVEPAVANSVFDRFLTLKAERLASQGIADPFASEAVRSFLREGLDSRLEGGAMIELHALTLDDQPIAIFGATANHDRFSALFTAFEADPAIARCSPGDILLIRMIEHCCARGLATFDLGVGEAHYKDKICDATEPLVETFLPVTMMGRAVAAVSIAKQGAKRAVKTSSLGQRALTLARRLKSKR